MAQPGMASRWRGRDPQGDPKGASTPEGGDEVQRSLELLDSVLSEFDDLENGNIASGAPSGTPAGPTATSFAVVAPTSVSIQTARSIRSIAGSGSGSGSGEGEGDLLISSSTPEDDSSPSLSLSLGGHQSEDDGYMSMNGRRNKLALNFRPNNGSIGAVVRRGSADMLTAPDKPLPPPPCLEDTNDFPPPPEEAQRVICNLLPRVSPSNSIQRGFVGLSGSRSSSSIAPLRQRQFPGSLPICRKQIILSGISPVEPRVTTATQTTLPMTRNQRPFGWEMDVQPPPAGMPPPPNRFASLPKDGNSQHSQPALTSHPSSWMPSRSAHPSKAGDEEERFSDDSLEGLPPPPPPPFPPISVEQPDPLSKRGSIAWEVPLDQDPLDPTDPLLTPGSTKVVGRRRRRQSAENSSSSSLHHLKDQDEWPDPPADDYLLSPYDGENIYETNFLPTTLSASDLSSSGTYVIRRGRKKERKPVKHLPLVDLPSNCIKLKLNYADVKRCSSTFDDLELLSKEGNSEFMASQPNEFSSAKYPLVRVISLPSLPHAEETKQMVEKGIQADQPISTEANGRLTGEQQERIKQQEERLIQRLQALAVTPEEDEPSSSLIFNDTDHQDDSLEPISGITFDGEDCFGDGPAPLSLIEEQLENGNDTEEPPNHRTNPNSLGGKLSQKELDEISVIQYRKQLPLPPDVKKDSAAAVAHADYYNLNKDRIAENCQILPNGERVEPTKDMFRPRKSASSNDVYNDSKAFIEHPRSVGGTRERDEKQPARRSSTDRRRHHQNMAAEMSSMERWRATKEMNNHVQIIPVVEKGLPLCRPSNNALSSLNRGSIERLKDGDKDPKKTHTVTVEVVQHDFGPLPPSPVDEFEEDEYSEILHPSPAQTPRGKADTLPEPFYKCREPLGSDPNGSKYLNRPPGAPPGAHREPTHSLKTRSMDAGFTRGFRNSSQSSAVRRESPSGSSSERRTLPTDLPGPSNVRRRAFQKRSVSQSSPQEAGMQTSCSLPETPIFTRGCDIPRTPHRRAPEVPSTGTNRSASRPGGLQTSSYRKAPGHGASLDSGGLGQAMVGAELLRLTGGPGRGWYPRHRTPRPASIEHLDRVAPQHSPVVGFPGPWDTRDSRKPMTLPPNITPKFFHRSPRDALRRVTSLLIRGKGSSSKESKKDTLSPSGGFGFGPHIWHREDARADCLDQVGETSRQKRGFFKGLWKRSRGYSLDHQ